VRAVSCTCAPALHLCNHPAASLRTLLRNAAAFSTLASRSALTGIAPPTPTPIMILIVVVAAVAAAAAVVVIVVVMQIRESASLVDQVGRFQLHSAAAAAVPLR
jgi:hypothetical protein